MTNRKCCICDSDILYGFSYLCKSCWHIYHDSINEPWLKALIQEEQRERYYKFVSQNQISLEELLEQENGKRHSL